MDLLSSINLNSEFMKKALLLLVLVLYANMLSAQNVLKGKVTDEQNQPILGVSIIEKGTTNGVYSDPDGNYSIKYKNENSVIAFSYIGLANQEITVGSQTEVNLVLAATDNILGTVEIVGSRRPNRTAVESVVPVDIIEVSQLVKTIGQPDVNQLLQFVAPSFNSNKQSGADGADHVDPATLRGLGPDQTLVLINGKRRHQSSLINIFGSRGRGNTGTDLNAIPVSAIDHIEILRDGAAAQYGSDAIAGVINVVLKSEVDVFSGNFSTGVRNATPPDEYNTFAEPKKFDGMVTQANGNYGTKIGDKGFVNVTLDYTKVDYTYRRADPSKYENGVYRNKFGDAASENFGTYFNSSFAAGPKTEIYMFGGYNYRSTGAYAFSRSADEERNVIEIYPNGFDPRIQSVITDKSLSVGMKTMVSGWKVDVNNTFGANNFHYLVDQTLNSSLMTKSPTRFDAGGFSLAQNTTVMDISRLFPDIAKGLNVAFGVEHRIETYQIAAGEEASYKTYGHPVFGIDTVRNDGGEIVSVDTTFRPGGSQGFPGFQPGNEVRESRSNFGAYVDLELDVTKKFTVDAAGRFEQYSDFGNTLNGKLAARYKLTNNFSLRGSVSSGFRAPSLAQMYFNTTFTDIVAGQAIDKIIAKNNSPITRELGIPQLKQEVSTNAGLGFTAKVKAFTLTVDGYYVQVKDRIVLTGSFYSDDDLIGEELTNLNIGAAQFFTNAVNTTSRGVDAIISYSLALGGNNNLRFSVAANFNDMLIDKIYTNDKLSGKENTYFGLREQYFLLASAPKSKFNFGVDYTKGNFFANLKLNRFGKIELINWNDNGDSVVDPGELDSYNAKVTVDMSAGYNLRNFTFTVGGANILNAYPDKMDPGLTESGGIWDSVQMGFSGALYFAKIGFKF
jgi:iron complex outermembrane receptor protein